MWLKRFSTDLCILKVLFNFVIKLSYMTIQMITNNILSYKKKHFNVAALKLVVRVYYL